MKLSIIAQFQLTLVGNQSKNTLTLTFLVDFCKLWLTFDNMLKNKEENICGHLAHYDVLVNTKGGLLRYDKAELLGQHYWDGAISHWAQLSWSRNSSTACANCLANHSDTHSVSTRDRYSFGCTFDRARLKVSPFPKAFLLRRAKHTLKVSSHRTHKDETDIELLDNKQAYSISQNVKSLC